MQPNSSSETSLAQFRALMERENIPALAIDIFSIYYRQYTAGKKYFIEENDINPLIPEDLIRQDDLQSYTAAGTRAISRCAVIKLNGGLGTTMGLRGPKSLVPVKNGRTFLDITIAHMKSLQQQSQARLPLLLMNSFYTHHDTLKALTPFYNDQTSVPIAFLQHRFPRIEKETSGPITCNANPAAQWSPPGHGDLYCTLITTGLLNQLVASGIDFAFISNIDNCGATLDTTLLGYMAAESIPFLMEVIERTPRDNKGGHLAKLKQGGLILREQSQCPPHELPAFSDISRYSAFNTNNIWVNLVVLKKLLSTHDGRLPLPLIVNNKTVETDQGPTAIVQLESAVGAAIVHFPEARLVQVNPDRFAPVKTCSDLLRVWSDCYKLSGDFRIIPSVPGTKPVRLSLDERYYSTIAHLQEYFPHGAPSLRTCSALTITGKVAFGRNVTLRGTVTLRNNSTDCYTIADNTTYTDQDIVLS